jgi:hypothetical protein
MAVAVVVHNAGECRFCCRRCRRVDGEDDEVGEVEAELHEDGAWGGLQNWAVGSCSRQVGARISLVPSTGELRETERGSRRRNKTVLLLEVSETVFTSTKYR